MHRPICVSLRFLFFFFFLLSAEEATGGFTINARVLLRLYVAVGVVGAIFNLRPWIMFLLCVLREPREDLEHGVRQIKAPGRGAMGQSPKTTHWMCSVDWAVIGVRVTCGEKWHLGRGSEINSLGTTSEGLLSPARCVCPSVPSCETNGICSFSVPSPFRPRRKNPAVVSIVTDLTYNIRGNTDTRGPKPLDGTTLKVAMAFLSRSS